MPNGSSQPPRKTVVTMPGDDEHVEVLGEVVGGEAPAAVLGVVAADELGVGLGQVERRAVGLGEARGEEDQEADELRARSTTCPPARGRCPVSDSVCAVMITPTSASPWETS